MPAYIEEELKRRAEKKGLSSKKKDAYVYGTINKIEKKMPKKHAMDKGKMEEMKKRYM